MTEGFAGDDPLVEVKEIADRLKVHKMSVYRLIHTGKLPALRIGTTYRVYQSDVDKHMASLAYAPRPGHKTSRDKGRRPTEDLYVYLGARLKELREKKGVGVMTMAAKMGIDRMSVHNSESGRRRTAVHQLVEYCDVLGEDPAAVLAAVLAEAPRTG